MIWGRPARAAIVSGLHSPQNDALNLRILLDGAHGYAGIAVVIHAHVEFADAVPALRALADWLHARAEAGRDAENPRGEWLSNVSSVIREPVHSPLETFGAHASEQEGSQPGDSERCSTR